MIHRVVSYRVIIALLELEVLPDVVMTSVPLSYAGTYADVSVEEFHHLG